MDLVLRKRVCFNVYKRHSLTDKIRRRMGHTSNLAALGVIYEIVSNIPKVSERRISFNRIELGAKVRILFDHIGNTCVQMKNTSIRYSRLGKEF